MFDSVKNWVRSFLLQSQEYTGTDNVYVAKQGFWTTAGFAFNSIIGLLAVIAYASLVPPEVYGTYKYLLSLVGLLGFLTLSGANTAVAQSVAAGNDGALRYTVRLQLKWNMALVATGFAIASWYAWNGNWIFAVCMGILSISVPLTSAFNTYGPYLTSTRQFRKSSLYGGIAALIAGSLNLIAVLLSDSVVIWIVAYSVGTLLPCLYFYREVAHSLPVAPDKQEKSAILRYLGHLSLVNILSIIGQYIDKVLTFQFVGPAALAVYSFASLGPDRMKGWLKGVGGIIFPKVAERTLNQIDEVFYRRILMSAGIGALAAIAYSLAAPLAFRILFPKYLDSVAFSQVLSINLVATMANIYMGHVFTSQKIIPVLYVGATTVNILRIVAFIICGYHWGVWGIVGASVGVQLFNVVWHSYLWYWFVRRPGSAYSIR